MPGRRFALKPPQLTPSLKPLSPEDVRRGMAYPPNAILWTEEALQALQRFLRDFHNTAEGIPGGATAISPVDVRPGYAPITGNSELGWSPGNHRHAAPTGSPVHVGLRLVEQEGTALTLARSDHRHTVESWRTFGITIDGETITPVPGFKTYVAVPYSGTITEWYLEADQAGSAVMDIWKNRSTPRNTDSICASAKPTLSSQVTATGPPTGWTTAIAAGDILGFRLDSCSTLLRLTLIVTVRES